MKQRTHGYVNNRDLNVSDKTCGEAGVCQYDGAMTEPEQHGARTRRVRSDARENVARILDAAQRVLADDPAAPLEQVADTAGVSRATLHRHFASRQALLDALVADLTARYRTAFDQAKVASVPPLVALYRLTEQAFELKIAHPFTLGLIPPGASDGPAAADPVIQERLDRVFARLHAAGQIAVAEPSWCRAVYLALLHEVYLLPPGAAVLTATGITEDIGARVELLISSLVGALGGTAAAGGASGGTASVSGAGAGR